MAAVGTGVAIDAIHRKIGVINAARKLNKGDMLMNQVELVFEEVERRAL